MTSFSWLVLLFLKDGKRWLLRFGLAHKILCYAECLLLLSDKIYLLRYGRMHHMIRNVNNDDSLTGELFVAEVCVLSN